MAEDFNIQFAVFCLNSNTEKGKYNNTNGKKVNDQQLTITNFWKTLSRQMKNPERKTEIVMNIAANKQWPLPVHDGRWRKSRGEKEEGRNDLINHNKKTSFSSLECFTYCVSINLLSVVEIKMRERRWKEEELQVNCKYEARRDSLSSTNVNYIPVRQRWD